MRSSILLALSLAMCAISACKESAPVTPPDNNGSNNPVNGRIRYIELDADQNATTYITDESGSTPVSFATNAASFSPLRNGRMLMLRFDASGDRIASAAVVDSSGTTLREFAMPANANPPVALSPDGNLVLYSIPAPGAGSSYRVKNLSSGTDIEITPKGGNEGTVAFNAASTRITFYEEHDSTRTDKLIVANIDGTGRVVVTDLAMSYGDYAGGLAWSRAGDRLYFTREGVSAPTLWSIGIDGTNPIQLSGSLEVGTMPAVSPDGNTIAFAGAVTDNTSAEIWLVNRDGSNLRKLTSGVAAGHFAHWPAWSPDGRKILYTDADASNDGFGGVLKVVDVATGTSTVLDNGPNAMWGYWDNQPL